MPTTDDQQIPSHTSLSTTRSLKEKKTTKRCFCSVCINESYKTFIQTRKLLKGKEILCDFFSRVCPIHANSIVPARRAEKENYIINEVANSCRVVEQDEKKS